MSRTYHHGERRLRVKAIRRDPPDLKHMSRALLELAKAQAEADAQAMDVESKDRETSPTSSQKKQKKDKQRGKQS